MVLFQERFYYDTSSSLYHAAHIRSVNDIQFHFFTSPGFVITQKTITLVMLKYET